MPTPFLQSSYVTAARKLREGGLRVRQIPQAVQVVKETVEQWVQKELENGNTQQVFQILKGHAQEKGPQLLFDKLKDMLLVRLMLHLGIKGALASNIITLILPFVLKKAYEMAKENPKVQAWWKEQDWKQKVPTVDQVKTKLKEVRGNIYASKTIQSGEEPLFV